MAKKSAQRRPEPQPEVNSTFGDDVHGEEVVVDDVATTERKPPKPQRKLPVVRKEPVAAKQVVGKKKAPVTDPAQKVELAKKIGTSIRAMFGVDTSDGKKKKESLLYSNAMLFGGSRAIGLPMPFPCQYLLDSSVFPLSRVVTLVGGYSTNKSSFQYEVARWHILQGGFGYFIDCENKASGQTIETFMQTLDASLSANYLSVPAYSVDDWQTKLQTYHKDARTLLMRKMRGAVVPIMFGLDSLSGQLSEASQTTIETKGHGDRMFAHEALMNTQFLKKFSGDLASWPFTLVVVNHLKKGQKDNPKAFGPPPRQLPGGEHTKFQESYELEFSRDSKIDMLDHIHEGGFKIAGSIVKISIHKNSVGADRRFIKVPVYWWLEAKSPGEDPIHYAKWDWDIATTALFADMRPIERKKLESVFDFHQVSRNKAAGKSVDRGVGDDDEAAETTRGDFARSKYLFWSDALGIPNTSPVSAAEFGAAFNNSQQVMRAVRRCMGIKENVIFEVGRDYQKQLRSERRRAERRDTRK